MKPLYAITGGYELCQRYGRRLRRREGDSWERGTRGVAIRARPAPWPQLRQGLCIQICTAHFAAGAPNLIAVISKMKYVHTAGVRGRCAMLAPRYSAQGVVIGALILTSFSVARAEDAGGASSASASSSSASSASSAGSSPSSGVSRSDLALGIQSAQAPENGLAIGGFLVYPSIFVGAIYNSNLFTTQYNRVGGVGLQVAPSLSVFDDQGVHKTTLNLNANAQLYPNGSPPPLSSGSSPNNVTGVVSLDHVWKPAADLTIDVKGAITRQFGIFGTVGAPSTSFGASATPPIAAAGSQQYSNLFSAGLSVEKLLTDRWFVKGGVGAQANTFDSPPFGISGSQNGSDGNAFVRTGFWVTPQLSAFVEGDGDWWRYQNSWYNANNYRLIAGLSSDLIGLFKGEIYAGYQTQFSANRVFGTVSAPAYGGSISYFPTRYLTFSASLSQSFGSAATAPSPTTVFGTLLNAASSNLGQQARFQASYAMSSYWSASAYAGWARTTWSNSPVIETAWTLGGSVNYNFWRHVALTLNYQYMATSANRAYVAVYTQNVVSAGLTYSY